MLGVTYATLMHAATELMCFPNTEQLVQQILIAVEELKAEWRTEALVCGAKRGNKILIVTRSSNSF